MAAQKKKKSAKAVPGSAYYLPPPNYADPVTTREWRECKVHGYASQWMPQADTAAAITAVAIVEDDLTGDVMPIPVTDVRFLEPLPTAEEKPAGETTP